MDYLLLLIATAALAKPFVDDRKRQTSQQQLSPNQFINPSFGFNGTSFQPNQFIHPSFQQSGNNTNFNPNFVDPSQFISGAKSGGSANSNSTTGGGTPSSSNLSPQMFMNPFSSGGNSSFNFIDPSKFLGK